MPWVGKDRAVPDVTSVQYKHKELTELMLKDRGIHEGLWVLQIRFGLGAVNAGPSEDDVHPTAMVPVQGIGILRVDQPGPLVVDAAVVNPASQTKAKIKSEPAGEKP